MAAAELVCLLEISEPGVPVHSAIYLFAWFRSSLGFLNVEHWPRRLHIAEGDLPQAALKHQLTGLRPGFCRGYSTGNLLFHTLQVAVLPSVSSTPISEQIGLGKLAQRLLRIRARPYGGVNDIVEILVGIVFRVINRDKLLELYSLYKILVLWRHQTIKTGLL